MGIWGYIKNTHNLNHVILKYVSVHNSGHGIPHVQLLLSILKTSINSLLVTLEEADNVTSLHIHFWISCWPPARLMSQTYPHHTTFTAIEDAKLKDYCMAMKLLRASLISVCSLLLWHLQWLTKKMKMCSHSFYISNCITGTSSCLIVRQFLCYFPHSHFPLLKYIPFNLLVPEWCSFAVYKAQTHHLQKIIIY